VTESPRTSQPVRPLRRATLVHRLAIAGAAVAGLVAAVLAGRLLLHHGYDPAADAPPLAAALLALVVALLLAAVAVFRPELGRPRGLVRTSAAWSLTLLCGLAGLWHLIWSEVDPGLIPGSLITTEAEATLDEDDFGDAPAIPTGVLLQSFEFLSGNNVKVTGYVWQKWAKSIPDRFERGVVLPDAIAAYDLEKVYQYDRGDYILTGWYFNTTLRQEFSYRDYPLDRQNVWLRMWERDFDMGAFLVPDFAAYPSMDPRSLPGIDVDMVTANWDPSLSGFSRVPHDYRTNFGFDDWDPEGAWSELYFNFVVKRDFLNPLFKNVPFMLAISSLLFATLVMTSVDETRKKRFGLSAYAVLAANGALLFTVILEHGSIRETVGSQQLAYIEVLPFTLYAMILLVTLNAVMVDVPGHQSFFDYHDNILPRAAFWPILLGILFTVTYLNFF